MQEWPGQEVTPRRPSGPPMLGQSAGGPLAGPPRMPPLATPQAPALERHTNVETGRTQQQIDQSNTQGHDFQDENSLRQQYRQNPSVQAYESILPIFRAAQTAADNTAGDQNMVYAFAKVMDPGSVVREGEQASVAATGSIAQRTQGYLDYIGGHGRLTPEMRTQLLHEMATRGSSLDRDYMRVRNDMVRNSERYGFDPHAIVGQHAALPYRQTMGLDAPPTVQAPTPQRPDHSGQDVVFPGEPRPPAEYQRGDPSAAMQTWQAQEQTLFDNGATREQMDRASAARGAPPYGPALDQAISWRDRHGRGARIVAPTTAPARTIPQGDPTSISESIGTNIRGASSAGSAGLDHPLAALYNTYGPGGSGTVGENLWKENEYDAANQQAHPWANIAGNLEGAFALPTGAPGAAKAAATEAMRSGLTRAEAITAARVAAGRRLGMEGAGYGFVHGTSTGEGDLGNRLKSGAFEAGMGGLTGYAGRFGPGFGSANRRPPMLPPLVDRATGHLNEPLESMTPAQRVAAAQTHGINLPLGSATDRGGAILEKGLDVSPASAGVMNDARRGTEAQTTAALENAASNYGAARGHFDAGTAARTGAQSWIDRAQGVAGDQTRQGVISKAYDAIPIPPTADAALSNTRNILNSMLDIFRSNPDMRSIFQNGRLSRYLDAITPPHDPADELGVRDVSAGLARTVGRTTEQQPGRLSWQDLKHFRSIVGEEIGAERFSDSPARSQLRALYAGLSEDMRATATAHGPNAIRTFERANNLNRGVETRIEDSLVPILGNDSRLHPERAAAFIQSIAHGGRSNSNLNQLASVRASLVKGGHWDEVASGLIRLGGQPADSPGRAFDPQTFIRWYSDLPEQARSLMFAGRGRGAAGQPRGDLRQALDSFVAVTQRLANTNALRNTSNTTPARMGAGAIVGASAMSAGLVTHPIATVLAILGAGATGAANYGIARAWTNPKFVRLVTNLASTSAAPRTAATIQRQRELLSRTARSSPDIADAIFDLDHRLFGQPNGPPNP